MPQWGRLTAINALIIEAWSVALYCLDPSVFGEGPLRIKRNWRVLLARPDESLFDAAVGLAAVRVAFYLAVAVLPCGARLTRRQLHRWHCGVAVASLAAVGSVAYRRIERRLGARHAAAAIALCCCGLLSAELWRGSWDWLRARPPRERDVFAYASEELQRWLTALGAEGPAGPPAPASSPSHTHGGDPSSSAALLPRARAPPSSPRLTARFLLRGESIRAYWSSLLDHEITRAKALLRLEPEREAGRAPDGAFSLLLRLFAHEDVLDQLSSAFARDTASLAFHSLQLATFVLFGAFWDGPALRDFLLGLCAVDLHFAHRVEWYVAGPDKGDFNPSVSRSYAFEKGISTWRENPKRDEQIGRAHV